MSVKSTVDRTVSNDACGRSTPSQSLIASSIGASSSTDQLASGGKVVTVASGNSAAMYSVCSTLDRSSGVSKRVGACTLGSTPRTSVSYQILARSRASSGVLAPRLIRASASEALSRSAPIAMPSFAWSSRNHWA